MADSIATPNKLYKENPFTIALYGFMASRLLVMLHKLNVFKEIDNTQHINANTFARDHNLNVDAFSRVVESAAAWGLLDKNGDKYTLPETVSKSVSHDSSGYLGPIIDHFHNNTIPLFENLESTVRSGKPQWEAANDNNGDHAFKNLFSSPEYADAFHRAMWNLGFQPSIELVSNGLLDRINTLVDLGGGSGSFAISACSQQPTITATVFDLPEVAVHCDRNIVNHGLIDRVTFLPGDFWKDKFPAADAYSLGYVLSNWSDDDCIRLLQKIRHSLPVGGKVIILERILEEDRSGPFVGLMQDLAMLIETGGKHRSLSHYKDLLKRSGYSDYSVMYSSYDKHAICGKNLN